MGERKEKKPIKRICAGLLAHVDAGKTTLTESLLYASGAISEPGSVEKGTTRTDTMFLERQRGITIQAAVTSFQWHRCKVNIVDALKNLLQKRSRYRRTASGKELCAHRFAILAASVLRNTLTVIGAVNIHLAAAVGAVH